MTTLKLCEAVNWQIQLAGMQGESAKIVKTCVGRYTCGKGVSEKVQYLLYRACNAVKRLLGQQSDWQQAEKQIVKHVYSYIPSPCRGIVKRTTENQVHFVAGKTLQFLVWENERKLQMPEMTKTLLEGQMGVIKGAVSNFVTAKFPSLNQYGATLALSLYAAKELYNLIPANIKSSLTNKPRELYDLFKSTTVSQSPSRSLFAIRASA
jgi:hypothetical protein